MQGRDNPIKSPLRLRDPVLAPALVAVAMTGCHSTMTSAHDPSPAGSDAVSPNMVPPPGHGPFTGTVADWPLWFVRPEFGDRKRTRLNSPTNAQPVCRHQLDNK